MDICRICGIETKLTKEHVIPKSAGNNQRYQYTTFKSMFKGWDSGEIFQGGLTRKTICSNCNNTAGKYYVPAFISWTKNGYEHHFKDITGSSILLPFTFQPLQVAKQLGVMVLAMAGMPAINLSHFENLRSLVCSIRKSGQTTGFVFWVYLHYGPPICEDSFFAIDTNGKHSPMVFCHVGLEPMGYVVTSDSDASREWAVSKGLCNISYFFEQQYNAIRSDHLRLSRLRGRLII